MPEASPSLPTELLLDVLEHLFAAGDKTSHKSAASLAQSCRALRTSELGKRTRYVQALATRSISLPGWLPEDLEYEACVLEPTRWPHNAPAGLPSIDVSAQRVDVCSAELGKAGRIVTLSVDGKSLHCYSIQPGEAPSTQSSLPTKSSPSLESLGTPRVIPLSGQAALMAVTDDSHFCAVLYREQPELEGIERRDEDPACEIIEIWDVHAATRYSRLCLSAEHRGIEEIVINAEFILMERFRDQYTEVRRWRSSQHKAEPNFPVLWSHEADHGRFLGVSLISPNFLAHQVLAFAPRERGEEPVSHLSLHRLEQSTCRHIAVISMYGATTEPESFGGSVKCGERVAPGEDGLVLIDVLGTYVSRGAETTLARQFLC